MAQNQELDDLTISHGTNLLRRIAAQVHYMEDASSPTGFRVTSAAFKNDRNSDRLSVVIEDRTPHSYEEIVLMKDKMRGLISLTAGFVRAHGQIVVHSHREDEPGHGDIIGDKPSEIRAAFAAACDVLIEPKFFS